MNDRQGLACRIKYMREYRNLTIEAASEMCDCSDSTWKQYERGQRLPSLPKLINICLALRVKPEYLLGTELSSLQEDSELEQLKLLIERLTPDDITVISTAITKCLELRDRK